MRHPFSGAEPEAIRAALVEIGAKKVEEFPELLNKLVSLLRAKDPIHVLAVLAGYGLQVGVSAKGISEKPLIPNLEQHHLELLQALILTLPIEEWGNDPAMPGDVQQVIDTISDLGDAFHQRRYKAIEQELDLQARTVLGLQERLRLHTQIVRNWGYFSDVVQISTELYGSLDEEFRNKFGFGASDVITVARCVLSTFEQRANERFKLLRRVFRERKISRMIRRYYECYPDMKGSPEELLSVLPPSATPEDVGFMILAHADLALPELLTFNSEAVASQAGLAPELVAKILGALSLRPGALKGGNPEYFFLSNPVWQAPLIRMQEAFFVALPQCIFSHIHDVMRSLAEATELKAAVERRRAVYLETKVRHLLGTILPTGLLRHGIKWRTDDEAYETDHVALIDKTIIIVEDKSASLSAPGLRGAPDRVRRHVRELICDPSEQSARLEEMIWRAKAGDQIAVANLLGFGMEFSNTERVLRISVTLDDFSALSSAEQDLREAGWIPADTALAGR